MRIARVEYDGAVRAAIVTPEADAVRVLPPEVGVSDLLGGDRDRLAALAREEVAIAAVRLLSPVQPPTIRDFSVFEQHVEGVIKLGSARREGPRRLVRVAVLLLLEPACRDRARRRDRGAAGMRGARPRAGGRGRHRPARDEPPPEEAGAHIAGYTIFNDWSARDLQRAELDLGLGFCKAKDFANTLGPWIVTADELEPYRSGDRLDLDLRASINGEELGHDTLANMAWSWEELVVLRVARHVGPDR